MTSLCSLPIAFSIAVLPCAAAAQDPPTGGQEPPQGGGRGGRAQEPEIRPYVYNAGPPQIDAYRRNLQRAYVETLAERVNGAQAAVNDSRAFFRGELKTLGSDLQTAFESNDRPGHAAAHRGRAQPNRSRARSHRAGGSPRGPSHHCSGRRALRSEQSARALLD
jgi:hypothetical protein